MFAAVKADMEGNFEDALADLRQGVAIAAEVEEIPLLVEGHLRTGFTLYNQGDLEGAESELERCSLLAQELGSTRDEARATFLLALIKFLRGDLEDAERIALQTRTWLERTGETFFQIQNLIAMAQYALARGEVMKAEELLREALPIALDEDSFLTAEIYRLLTQTLIRQDRLDDASELAEFAARGTGEEHPYTRAAILMTEAVVATALGELDRAADGYSRAIALLGELGLPIERNQGRIAYARVLRDMGESEAARQQLQEARDACARMGATGLVVDVDAELALMGTPAA
jgi:ATP/maltotriose-dependent transcriptional regulator MalT